MRIVRIFAHRVELPLQEGSYKWSGGKSVTIFDSTIIGMETDTGLGSSWKMIYQCELVLVFVAGLCEAGPGS
jgi:hypothetical protein